MSPTQARKKGRRYNYYVSRPLLFGNASTANVGSVARVPAHDVNDQVRKIVPQPQTSNDPKDIDNAFAYSIIKRIEVRPSRLVVKLKPTADDPIDNDMTSIIIPWIIPPSKHTQSILHPTSIKLPLRPRKLERRAALVAAIARGRRWLDELVAGKILDTQSIACREHCSPRHVNDDVPRLPLPHHRQGCRRGVACRAALAWNSYVNSHPNGIVNSRRLRSIPTENTENATLQHPALRNGNGPGHQRCHFG